MIYGLENHFLVFLRVAVLHVGFIVYTKTQVRTYFIKNMEKFYHSSNGFLMLHVQNVCIEAIIISLNPILTAFVMILS